MRLHCITINIIPHNVLCCVHIYVTTKCEPEHSTCLFFASDGSHNHVFYWYSHHNILTLWCRNRGRWKIPMLPTVRSSNEIQAITTIREQHIGFDSNLRMQTPSCWAAPRPGINMAELFAASDSFWTVMIRWGALESRGISSVWSPLNFCIVVIVLTTSYTYLSFTWYLLTFSGALCFVHYELQGPNV